MKSEAMRMCPDLGPAGTTMGYRWVVPEWPEAQSPDVVVAA